MIGRLEASSTGCILLLEYKLFPNIRMIVTLSGLLVIFLALFFYYQTRQWAFPVGGVFILGAIYLIIRSNFRLHLKPLRETVYKLLSRAQQ